MDPYVMLIDLGVSLTKALLGSFKGGKYADTIGALLDVGQSFLDALEAHKADVLTKANFEAQRG